MIAVRTENVTKTFNQIPAVDNINFEIEKGKVVGLIGPDGAGKTTLLRLLAGLLIPNEGHIQIDGIDAVKETLKVKKRIGYMPQHFSLYGDLTVAENLKFFADMYQVPERRYREKKKELLSFSQLAPFEKRLARNLSGGMQKKLALASNLFHTPEILFLDEPTTGVDPISRRELWNILFQLNKQGVTVFFTTPYMDEAQKCDFVGLIHKGRILTYKSPQVLVQEMSDEVIELLADQEKARKLLTHLPGLKNIYPFGETIHLIFEKENKGIIQVEQVLNENQVTIHSLKKITPSFEDVFLALIQAQKENHS